MFNQTDLILPGSSTPTPTPISGWSYAYYAYDPSHPHAVATIERSAGPDNFVYDAIGDMTTRNEAGVSWTQGFDEEGRLETISESTDTWTFTYDGDGNRVVQANPDDTTTQFWSGEVNHCAIAGCTSVLMTIPDPVQVVVQDTIGTPMEGLPVYVFNGATYTGKHGTTDANGGVSLRLVEGNYRFRADLNGTQFWSGEANHCTVPGCMEATVIVTLPVTLTVLDTDAVPQVELPVYVFDEAAYTGFHGTTDENGEVQLTLPQGDYRFRSDLNGTQFWSGEANHCTLPGCTSASVTVTIPLTVTVQNQTGSPYPDLPVYAFSGESYTGFHGTTDENGETVFTLPQGDYRFRTDYNGTQFWSDDVNHCTIPGCETATVVVTLPVTVTVEDGGGSPLDGVPVYVFDGSTYTGDNGTTNIDGEVDFTLLQGSYRFRADHGGEQYWSGEVNHCDIPGCEAVTIVANAAPTATPTPEPAPTDTPTPLPTPTPTDTPEPTATATPTESAFMGRVGLMAVMRPVPAELPLLEPDSVTVTVEDTIGAPKEGLPVYVFDGSSYTGYNDISDLNGEVVFDLPDGSYRFRSDMNGVQFWSGTNNHCTIPGCLEATIVVTIPVTVSVEDTNGVSKEGMPVYAFEGPNYTGYTGTTDVNGEVDLTLPQGDYRFRADYDGTQFWSGDVNHCTIPGCETATVEVTLPVVVTVLDTVTVPQVGLPVYVFDEAVYTGFNDTTDGNGEVSFTLPQGDYRFRSDLNGTQFWSDSVNHCTIPGCESVSITVTIPVTVTVQSQTGSPYPDLPVYVFTGENYTGFNGISDVNGQVVFTLPIGDYRFRSDYDGVQFWSDDVDHCSIPGCLEAGVEIPGGTGEVNVTIDYSYDPLYRLTEADYSTGEYFWYTYDAVGNRLTQETHVGLNTYIYDDANRLIEVDGTTFIWNDNGNLIQDDIRIYNYDYANRLRFVLMNEDTYNFEYSGLGDRLRQTVNGISTDYILDLYQPLTQVLQDSASTYVYGMDRIGEFRGTEWIYHLADVLDSSRQLTSSGSAISLTKSYAPFGSTLSLMGSETSYYGFVGEWADSTNLLNLRARYYSPTQGRFTSRDIWTGDSYRPLSFNEWLFGYANPILFIDPSGFAASAEERLDDIIRGVWPNGAEALFRAFEDNELQTTWGYQAGTTLKDRTLWLLNVSSGLPEYPNLPDSLLEFLGFQFGKPFGLDCGFAEEFRDSHLYEGTWGMDPAKSNQVGHFLSAVSLSYRFVIPREILSEFPQTTQKPEVTIWGDLALSMMIGHEQISDRPANLENLQKQLFSPTSEDIKSWYQAVEFDSRGQSHQRDQKLWEMLHFDTSTPFNDAEERRIGNSIQDLRLSLKGYRFAWYVYKNRSLHPLSGSYWLRVNLSKDRLLMNPFGP